MKYFSTALGGGFKQIGNSKILEQLNKKTFEVGQEVVVFGAVPHYLKVMKIEKDAIYFERG